VALLLAAAAPAHAGDADTPLEHLELRAGALGLVPVHVLRCDPGDVVVKVLRPSAGSSASPVSEMPGCAGAVACFNASFFTLANHEPSGLVISDGEVVHGMGRSQRSLFWTDSTGAPHVGSREEFLAATDGKNKARVAVQSQPLLVRKGKAVAFSNRMRGSFFSRRTAIGIDRQGRVVVVVSPLPISLAALADLAVEKLDVQDLLNLDGGSSTQLFLHQGSGLNFPGVAVPVGLAISPR
jgi:exopolysaccharide biosynthesis protein